MSRLADSTTAGQREQDVEAVVEALDVDACVRLACHAPLTSTVPGTSQVDGGLVDAVVSGLRRYAMELESSARALWEEERERGQAVVRAYGREIAPGRFRRRWWNHGPGAQAPRRPVSRIPYPTHWFSPRSLFDRTADG